MFESKLWGACLLMLGAGVVSFRMSATRRATLTHADPGVSISKHS
jgi:hypothetical protein